MRRGDRLAGVGHLGLILTRRPSRCPGSAYPVTRMQTVTSPPSQMPRRVLRVLQPTDGGVPQHVLGLSTGLTAHGWEVEVATAEGSAIAPALAEAGIPMHELPL